MKPVFFCDCEFHFPIFGLFLILGVLEAGFPFYRVIPFYRESRAGGKDPKSAQFPLISNAFCNGDFFGFGAVALSVRPRKGRAARATAQGLFDWRNPFVSYNGIS